MRIKLKRHSNNLQVKFDGGNIAYILKLPASLTNETNNRQDE
jgi:hypothetical protein